MTDRPAVVLLSGGLDSATTLAIARAEGFRCHALTIAYGQRHVVEIEAARAVAAQVGVVQHRVMNLDLRAFGGSALTADLTVPEGRSLEEMSSGIPITYVPARNTIFLALALAWAEVLGCFDIFVGVNAVDYSVHGDTQVWLRNKKWARLLSIREAYELPDDEYETIAVDPLTYEIGWRRVTHRARHRTGHKRAFEVQLERGQSIVVSEDHSLFTLNCATAELIQVKGCDITPGMPLVAPYDLSTAVGAWDADLTSIDLSGMLTPEAHRSPRHSLIRDGDEITNRLKQVRIPITFPLDDEFLYLVGLWLAEGGKDETSGNQTLAFSIGGIPGAVERATTYFARYGARFCSTSANRFDYRVSSSVFSALFWYLGLFGTSRSGRKRFPDFFWRLSQRQRRLIVAGLWDGDGSHVFKATAVLAQKSHALITDLYHVFALDGIFPIVKPVRHGQLLLALSRSSDFELFTRLYPLAHSTKRADYERMAGRPCRDKATGIWKCPGVWAAVKGAHLPVGRKTVVYNRGGKYDNSVRAQRKAFAEVPALQTLCASKLAFLQVRSVKETRVDEMYDFSVEGAENFLANGLLAHNSGYPDCRPEFIAAFEVLANLATKAGVEGKGRFRIHTPLIDLPKVEIIRRGMALGVDYARTHSCYQPTPEGLACGKCDSCLLRADGFRQAGIPDPTRYAP
jgi:queuosine biosynthesis protein QueC